MTTDTATDSKAMIRGGGPTVFVADLDTAVRFYTDTLGLRLQYRAGEHFAMVDAGSGLTIGLHPPGRLAPAPGTAGSIQIGLNVTGPIETVVESLRARGVVFREHEGRVVIDDGAVKLAFFHDPDGTDLYLCEVQAHQAASHVSLLQRRIHVDGVRVEGAEARRILRGAFLDATRQTGISVKHVRWVTMLIGGLLGGIVVLTFMLVPGLRAMRYGWLILAGAFVVLAFAARLIARRVLWWVYRNEIRLAMQQLGFELCVDCGYWLKGLPDDEPRCPECGAERRRLVAAPTADERP